MISPRIPEYPEYFGTEGHKGSAVVFAAWKYLTDVYVIVHIRVM